MIKLDDTLLQELGLAGLPEEEKKKLLAHIYETLEMRVGMKLAERMTDAQLSEFEQFIDRNDEAGALRWLETNFPNYKDVVSAEFERLKAEIGQAAPQILTASQQNQGQPPMMPSAPMQQQPPAPQQPMQPPANPYQQPPMTQPPYGQAPQPPYPTGPSMPPQARRDDYDLAA
ncbi:MAG TPA: DUF5663 domain-containing protein [Candidatus Saccharimonadales bacterium]|nr:DUF5663 domain-containing protein [Candidatus Saccharimonadales bacterium]